MDFKNFDKLLFINFLNSKDPKQSSTADFTGVQLTLQNTTHSILVKFL